MKRSLVVVLAVFSVLCLVASTAQAKKRKKKAAPAAPVSIQVQYSCKNPVNVLIAAVDPKANDKIIAKAKVAVDAGATSDAQSIDGKGSTVFKIAIGKGALPFFFFQPGGSYAVNLLNCRMNAADVVTQDLTKTAKSAKSASLRVRASRPGKSKLALIEYQDGGKGRFKRMSLAPSKPLKINAGSYQYGLRLKAGRRGPIVNNIKKKAEFIGGHKYLIEAWAVGKEIFVKIEDEGLDKK